MILENESIALTDIEMKIKKDKDGRFKNESVEFLESHLIEIKAALDNGLSPDEFKKFAQLKDAIGHAIKVIEQNWISNHGYVGKSRTLRYSK